MSLRALNIKKTYNTEEDNILEDFYIKALSNAIEYRRNTFTFSSHLLAYAARGLDGLIKSDGDMKLVFGDNINADDYERMLSGQKHQKFKDDCLKKLQQVLSECSQDRLFHHRLEILEWMIGSKKLKVKFARMKNDKSFHPKTGVIYGQNDERVVFKGSGNETLGGLDLNWGEFDVFKSWDKEIYKSYGQVVEDRFKKFWDNDGSSKVDYFTVPSEDLEAVFKESSKKKSRSVLLKPKPKELEIASKADLTPRVPKYINGKEFRFRDYQSDALKAWKRSDYRGIFEHATGSGKTITAIYGMVRMYESIKKGHLVGIIGVPYQILAEQWAEECSLFNINPIICYGESKHWVTNARNRIIEASSSEVSKLIVLIVVNKSLLSEKFREINNLIKDKNMGCLFIGDECHEYRSSNIENLPDARYRLGLSATPFDNKDSSISISRDENLRLFFNDTIDRFPLKKAIENNYLCKYEYKPIYINLSEDEQEEYLRLSKIIAALLDDKNIEDAQKIQGQRARLIGSADEKFLKLKILIKKLNKPTHTLIFSGDGKSEGISESEIKDKRRILNILREENWMVEEFTAEVDSNMRRSRINDFKDETLNALVAIKVLDQGINIPAIKTAIIVASSRSKRQYIQRLGRILRTSENKKLSTVYDFIVLPNKNLSFKKDSLSSLIEKEKERFDEFSKNAENRDEVNKELNKELYFYK